ncbi:hypothetical protein KUCAC02_036281, partial [Chaenocephalus aceratus]
RERRKRMTMSVWEQRTSQLRRHRQSVHSRDSVQQPKRGKGRKPKLQRCPYWTSTVTASEKPWRTYFPGV